MSPQGEPPGIWAMWAQAPANQELLAGRKTEATWSWWRKMKRDLGHVNLALTAAIAHSWRSYFR